MKYMEELLIKKFIEKELECGEHKCLDNIRAKRVRGGDIYVAHELSITDFNSDPIHRKEEGDMVVSVLELIAFTFDSLHPEGLYSFK